MVDLESYFVRTFVEVFIVIMNSSTRCVDSCNNGKKDFLFL